LDIVIIVNLKPFRQPERYFPATQTPRRSSRIAQKLALMAGLASLFASAPERQTAMGGERHLETNAKEFPLIARKDPKAKRSLIDIDFFGGLPVAATYREQLLAAFGPPGPAMPFDEVDSFQQYEFTFPATTVSVDA
jgi:hypothetical protein